MKSFATNEAGIKADINRIRECDSEFKKISEAVKVVSIIWLVLLVPALICFYFGWWIIGAIILVPFVLIALKTWMTVLLFPLIKKRMLQSYELGLATPALVIENSGKLKLLCLANMLAAIGGEYKYAVKIIEVDTVAPLSGRVGTQIPCASMFEPGPGNYHVDFSPRPLSWATADKSELNRVIQSMPEEWDLLVQVYNSGELPSAGRLKYI